MSEERPMFGRDDPARYILPEPPCDRCGHSHAEHHEGVGCLGKVIVADLSVETYATCDCLEYIAPPDE